MLLFYEDLAHMQFWGERLLARAPYLEIQQLGEKEIVDVGLADEIIQRATFANRVTAFSVDARGLDTTTHDPVVKVKGVQNVSTHMPKTRTAEIQMQGRMNRQDRTGGVMHYLLRVTELAVYKVDPEKLKT